MHRATKLEKLVDKNWVHADRMGTTLYAQNTQNSF